MHDYTTMTPLKRYAALADIAAEFFGTTQWKTKFCERYGLTNQTPTKWAKAGAPLWAVQAIRDARDMQRLHQTTTALRDVLDDLE